MILQDFDWFIDRLEVARWEDQDAGSRSAFFNCPVHGGSDSLHITEKNGKALVNCFGCGADYSKVVEVLEQAEEAPIRVRRTGARGKPENEPTVKVGKRSGTGGSTPPRLHQSPLDWAAERCSITRKELDALKLPISEAKEWLVFEFEAALKLRKAEAGKKKTVQWQGDVNPAIWPEPVSPSAEIVLCEGELDAICLRHSGFDAYSVTKGATSEIPDQVWSALIELGVERVLVCFDLDKEGRKGRDSAAQGARAAGLSVREVKVEGLRPLVGETDARDAAKRGYPLKLIDDATEDDAVSLRHVDLAPEQPLLLGWLHPLEHTILFGDGGTGKGVIASQWAADLVRADKRVLVVDYEQHARHEWRPRVQRFLCAHDTFHRDLCEEAEERIDSVFYVQPVKPIWEIASWIRSQAEKVQADYVIVDSVTYATAGMEPEKSATAVMYSQAVNIIGFPVLSIAHVTKTDGDARYPFGSIYWHNGARITIGVASKDESLDADRVIRHRKANQGQSQATMAIDWKWLRTDLPAHLVFRPAWTTAQEVYEGLVGQLGRDPTTDEMFEITNQQISDASIRKMRQRAQHKGTRPINHRRVKTESDEVVGSDDE